MASAIQKVILPKNDVGQWERGFCHDCNSDIIQPKSDFGHWKMIFVNEKKLHLPTLTTEKWSSLDHEKVIFSTAKVISITS